MKSIMCSAIGTASAIGIAIGILPVAASPALAIEITALTIDPIGTLVPGHTGVTITGKVVCDVTGTVDLEFVFVTQTKKKTQFGIASTVPVPYAAVPCGPFVTSWLATPVIDFSKSALLHKGKAGVQVQFEDAANCPSLTCVPGDPAHLVSAFVWLQ